MKIIIVQVQWVCTHAQKKNYWVSTFNVWTSRKSEKKRRFITHGIKMSAKMAERKKIR